MARYKIQTVLNVYLEWATNLKSQFYKQEDKYKEYYDQYYLDSQFEFFSEYLGFLYNDGINLRTIRSLFAMQTLDRDESKYLVQLEGGSPLSIQVAVENISDIDLIDAKCVAFYKQIIINNKFHKTWTSKDATEMITKVKEDLEWQGDKAVITHTIKRNSLILNVRVIEAFDGSYIGEL